jgi:hypothetical protein
VVRYAFAHEALAETWSAELTTPLNDFLLSWFPSPFRPPGIIA